MLPDELTTYLLSAKAGLGSISEIESWPEHKRILYMKLFSEDVNGQEFQRKLKGKK